MPTTRLDPIGNFTLGTNGNQWSPSAGSSWQCVDDGATPDDADYIQSDGDGSANAQRFEMSNLPTAAFGVSSATLTVRSRYFGGGGHAGPQMSWQNATPTLLHASYTATTSYANYTNTRTTDPDSVAWTVASINAIEVGVREASGGTPGDYVRCSWVKLEVDHLMPAGGFAFLVSGLVGAALGIEEMARLAALTFQRTRTLILPFEYSEAFAGIRGYRHPVYFF